MLFSNGCTWATILLLNDAESDFRLSCLVHTYQYPRVQNRVWCFYLWREVELVEKVVGR